MASRVGLVKVGSSATVLLELYMSDTGVFKDFRPFVVVEFLAQHLDQCVLEMNVPHPSHEIRKMYGDLCHLVLLETKSRPRSMEPVRVEPLPGRLAPDVVGRDLDPDGGDVV